MTTSALACLKCLDMSVERVATLSVVGGSVDPFNDPGGEIRACPACDALFRYERDHDNEIGYQALAPSLHRLERDEADRMIVLAITVARRQLAHFELETDDYSRGVADECRAEIARLEARSLDPRSVDPRT